MLLLTFWLVQLMQMKNTAEVERLSQATLKKGLTHYNLTLLHLERKFDVERVKPTVSFEILLHTATHSPNMSASMTSVQSWCLEGPQDALVLSLPPCSSSPQHIEECCGWMRAKLNDLNKEQHHIVHQHQEQVSFTLTKHQAGSLLDHIWTSQWSSVWDEWIDRQIELDRDRWMDR